MPRNKQQIVSEIVKERMDVLFRHAMECAVSNSNLSREYVKKIRKLGAHCRTRLPKAIKENICKNCDSVLIPGLNAKVRIASGKRYVVYECTTCNAEKHVRY